MQKKKKLKQQLEREIQADERNIRAARIIAPRSVGRPSNQVQISDVVEPAPSQCKFKFDQSEAKNWKSEEARSEEAKAVGKDSR